MLSIIFKSTQKAHFNSLNSKKEDIEAVKQF